MRKDGWRTDGGTGFHVCINETGKGKKNLPVEISTWSFFGLLTTDAQPPPLFDLERTAKRCSIFLARDIGLGLELGLELHWTTGLGERKRRCKVYRTLRSWEEFSILCVILCVRNVSFLFFF